MGYFDRLSRIVHADQFEKDRAAQEAILRPLIAAGYQPNEINAVLRNFSESGEMNLPTHRTKTLPPQEEGYRGPRSTRVPIRMGKTEKKKVPVRFNKDTGEYLDPLPNDPNAEPDFIEFNPPDPDKPSRPEKDPREAARIDQAERAIQDYRKAIASGDPVPVDLEEQAVSGAKYLGLPVTKGEAGKLTFGENAQNALSLIIPGLVSPAKPPKPPPKIEFPKRLTEEQAQIFLKQAGGDKEKARELAKENGWSF